MHSRFSAIFIALAAAALFEQAGGNKLAAAESRRCTDDRDRLRDGCVIAWFDHKARP